VVNTSTSSGTVTYSGDCAPWSLLTGRLVSWSDTESSHYWTYRALFGLKANSHIQQCAACSDHVQLICVALIHTCSTAQTMPLPCNVAVFLLSRAEIFLDKW